MKLYLFPPSGRVLGIVALKNHLGLDCEVQSIDLGRGDQLAPEYLALNSNKKMPTLVDDGFVLWESNAILFYMAAKQRDGGLWPSDLKGQADVLRWLAWESAHWDAESCGMVAYEKASKTVLGLGPPDPAFIARGEPKLRPFRDCTQRFAHRQDMAHWRTAHDRRFFRRWTGTISRTHGASRRKLPRDPSLVQGARRAAGVAGRCGNQRRGPGRMAVEKSWLVVEPPQ